jgi:hypothetical protein
LKMIFYIFFIYQKYRKSYIFIFCQKYLTAIYNAVVVFFIILFNQNNQFYFHFYFNLINNLGYKLNGHRVIINIRNTCIMFLKRHYLIPSIPFFFQKFFLIFLRESGCFIKRFQCSFHQYSNLNINWINFCYFQHYL